MWTVGCNSQPDDRHLAVELKMTVPIICYQNAIVFCWNVHHLAAKIHILWLKYCNCSLLFCGVTAKCKSRRRISTVEPVQEGTVVCDQSGKKWKLFELLWQTELDLTYAGKTIQSLLKWCFNEWTHPKSFCYCYWDGKENDNNAMYLLCFRLQILIYM